jgi:hypothetical protein
MSKKTKAVENRAVWCGTQGVIEIQISQFSRIRLEVSTEQEKSPQKEKEHLRLRAMD